MFTPWRSGHCHLRKTLQATRPAPATELCEGICSTTPLCVKSIHPTHTGKSRQKQVCKKLLFMEDDRSLKYADFVPRERKMGKTGVASCRWPGHTVPATPHLHSFLARPHPCILYANVNI